MRKIGIVASGSTEMNAYVVLSEGEEKKVKAEDLVLIRNRNGNEIISVCRGGLGSNENLKISGYSPGVAYARGGRHPSYAKEFYAFGLNVIGKISEGSLSENKMLIAPTSDVELYEDSDNPMKELGQSPQSIGYYKGHPNWRVPINQEYICYHMGVFASTGAGKSLLTRHQIIPFIQNAGYNILIFDWKGSDYAPYFENVVSVSDLALDDEVVVDYLSSAMNHFGYYQPKIIERNPIRTALETIIYDEKWRDLKEPDELRIHLKEKVKEEIINSGSSEYYIKRDTQRFERALERVSSEQLRNVMGQKTPENIFNLVKVNKILVLDVSLGGKDEKLSVFLTIGKYLRDLMQKKQKLNLSLIIDEGPQYCPYKPEDLESRTTEMISELCALGRSYNCGIILLSQGIAGEIGINAAIRRNLNTQFIGKLNPLDLDEAIKLLGQAEIEPKYLIIMPVGDFYITGKMNPSPIPLLIHFDI